MVMSTSDNNNDAAAAAAAKEARWSELVLFEHHATARIRELEATVDDLRAQLASATSAAAPLSSMMATTTATTTATATATTTAAATCKDGDDGAPRPLTAASAGRYAAARIGGGGGGGYTALQRVTAWNEELVRTVHTQRDALLRREAEYKAQLVVLTDQAAALARENAQLRSDSDALKRRVADDVLRQRQTNRIEVAYARAKMAARVRASGRARLEALEAVLMETHDDVYYVRRCDALAVAPQREVSFVLNYVAGLTWPLAGTEAFVMSVYDEILRATSRQHGGYGVATHRGMHVHAFQRPRDALAFARACHEQLLRLPWQGRADAVPVFACVVNEATGELVFRGPRVHTCIYACTPECVVDPVTGQYAYCGRDMQSAVRAALLHARVGEIVVNDTWATLLLRDARVHGNDDAMAAAAGDGGGGVVVAPRRPATTASAATATTATTAAATAATNNSTAVVVDGADADATARLIAVVRATLGATWDVALLPPGQHGIVYALLPTALKARRAVDFHALHPTPRYPYSSSSSSSNNNNNSSAHVTSNNASSNAVYSPHSTSSRRRTSSAFGTATTTTTTTSSSSNSKDDEEHDVEAAVRAITRTMKDGDGSRYHHHHQLLARPAWARGCGDVVAAASSSSSSSSASSSSTTMDTATQLLAYYSVRDERDRLAVLFRQATSMCAALERDALAREDRFELSKRKPLDPSEVAYVCTIDTGDDAVWRAVVRGAVTGDEYEQMRNSIRAYIHTSARQYYGFLMNGNYVDVFTYVFREVEQALAFVSQVYIMINRTGTKYVTVHGGGSTSKGSEGGSVGSGNKRRQQPTTQQQQSQQSQQQSQQPPPPSSGMGASDVMLFRAGISGGPMSTIYRHMEAGLLKCTGPAIRLSGTLCELARSGEILAMEDVIYTFHAKNENLLDAQYNIVKQRGQFLHGCDAPAVVHSILPKPFAYRRRILMQGDGSGGSSTSDDTSSGGGAGGVQRSRNSTIKAALTPQTSQYARERVDQLLQQLLARLERAEAAQLTRHDAYEATHTPQRLRNAWMCLRHINAAAAAAAATTNAATTRARRPSRSTDTDGESEYSSGSNVGSSGGGGVTTSGGSSNVVTVVTAAATTRRGRSASRSAAAEYSDVELPPLAFLFCDVVNTTALARDVTAAVLQRVLGGYNAIAQDVFAHTGGAVLKTNGSSAYLVAFACAEDALEAGVTLQRRLCAATWPDELRTLEHTLHVRDVKRGGVVLFSGPRVQVAVHYTGRYVVQPLLAPWSRSADAMATTGGSKYAVGGSSSRGKRAIDHDTIDGVDAYGDGDGDDDDDDDVASLCSSTSSSTHSSAARRGNTRASATTTTTTSTTLRRGRRRSTSNSNNSTITAVLAGRAGATAATSGRNAAMRTQALATFPCTPPSSSDAAAGNGAAATPDERCHVHVCGIGIDELILLGRRAHGGEVRVSRAVLNVVGASVRGKLLLQQLAMEVIVAPSAIRVVPATLASGNTSSNSNTSNNNATTLVARSSGGHAASSTSSPATLTMAVPPVRSPASLSTRHRDRRASVSSSVTTLTATASPGSRGESSNVGNSGGSGSGSTHSSRRGSRAVLQRIVVAEECVVVVPRELEGRLPLLQLPPASSSAASSALPVMLPYTQPASSTAAATARAATTTTTTTVASMVPGAMSTPLHTAVDEREDGNNSGSSSDRNSEHTSRHDDDATTTTTTMSDTQAQPHDGSRSAAAADAHESSHAYTAPPLSWLLDESGALQPLPPTLRGPWQGMSNGGGSSSHIAARAQALELQMLLSELLQWCGKYNDHNSSNSKDDDDDDADNSTAAATTTTADDHVDNNATTTYTVFMHTVSELLRHVHTAMRVGNEHYTPDAMLRCASANGTRGGANALATTTTAAVAAALSRRLGASSLFASDGDRRHRGGSPSGGCAGGSAAMSQTTKLSSSSSSVTLTSLSRLASKRGGGATAAALPQSPVKRPSPQAASHVMTPSSARLPPAPPSPPTAMTAAASGSVGDGGGGGGKYNASVTSTGSAGSNGNNNNNHNSSITSSCSGSGGDEVDYRSALDYLAAACAMLLTQGSLQLSHVHGSGGSGSGGMRGRGDAANSSSNNGGSGRAGASSSMRHASPHGRSGSGGGGGGATTSARVANIPAAPSYRSRPTAAGSRRSSRYAPPQ